MALVCALTRALTQTSTAHAHAHIHMPIYTAHIHIALHTGLVQLKNGPCGVLAAVQCWLFYHLLFRQQQQQRRQQQQQPFQFDFSDAEQRELLVSALHSMLWNPHRRAQNECCVVLPEANVPVSQCQCLQVRGVHERESSDLLRFSLPSRVTVRVSDGIPSHLFLPSLPLPLLLCCFPLLSLFSQPHCDDNHAHSLLVHHFTNADALLIFLTENFQHFIQEVNRARRRGKEEGEERRKEETRREERTWQK